MTASAAWESACVRTAGYDAFCSQFRHAIAAASPGMDLVGVGANLAIPTILAAYTSGVFPMGVGAELDQDLGWWSPDPRGVLPLDNLQISRSLRRSLRQFEIRVDTAFDAVVSACADPTRPGAWITPAFEAAYRELHALEVAHSVEAWQNDRLVGGLFGLSLGGLFAGESMFHRVTDASKAALVGLVRVLQEDTLSARRLVDVQWRTDHLATLGVVEMPREKYLSELPALLATSDPRWLAPKHLT